MRRDTNSAFATIKRCNANHKSKCGQKGSYWPEWTEKDEKHQMFISLQLSGSRISGAPKGTILELLGDFVSHVDNADLASAVESLLLLR
jgi:hypothetical protein